jgi:hypothetical protein
MGESMTEATPEAKAARETKRARLRQTVTLGCTLIRQRDTFVGKLSKREISQQHTIETSAKRCCDEAIEMLFEHPELRDMVHHHDFTRLRDAFPPPWPTRIKNR